MTYDDSDYDEIEYLIDNNTIELGRRYREALARIEELETALSWAIHGEDMGR